ncbi:MAG: SDR family oxidoreductase [Bacteroidetes bacterium]|nr:SDR family oxidoreductase [Bacteroidota bacterium]
MLDLSGQVAIVTGGSRGIGASIAELLARVGADVVITYHRDKRAADRVACEVRSFGPECLVVRADVSKPADVRRTVRAAMKQFGRIDVLVNNAGIWTYGAIGRMSERVWDETLDVNMKGTFLFCNEVVPHMKKRRSGRIINIASTAGQRGEAFHSHYAASKGAMIAFTKSIGPELAPFGILVNNVAPGWVDTDMSASALRVPASLRQVTKGIPNRRVATGEDIAGAVLFLASEFSAHLVGSTISVNGGGVLVG